VSEKRTSNDIEHPVKKKHPPQESRQLLSSPWKWVFLDSYQPEYRYNDTRLLQHVLKNPNSPYLNKHILLLHDSPASFNASKFFVKCTLCSSQLHVSTKMSPMYTRAKAVHPTVALRQLKTDGHCKKRWEIHYFLPQLRVRTVNMYETVNAWTSMSIGIYYTSFMSISSIEHVQGSIYYGLTLCSILVE